MQTSTRVVVFDLDGVITDTAAVHASAWKEMFDAFLVRRGGEPVESLRPFDRDLDYHRYVDGKPRYDGVISFLEARGIKLAYGQPEDPVDRETVCGLGNRKDELFKARLDTDGVQSFPATVALIDQLTNLGIRMAVVSSSRNAREVLQSAGLSHRFETIVDGVEADQLGLPGKPNPAVFLEALRRMSVEPREAVLIEDAVSGVEAGRRGGFDLVVGVDRSGRPEDLYAAGADVVVGDLAEVDMQSLGIVVGWQTLFEGFDPAVEGQREALCTLGNGYFATRGALPEAASEDPFCPATYIAGVFNRPLPSPDTHETDTETIVNLPNWLSLRFRVEDNDWFDIRSTDLLEHKHELDIRNGLLVRHLRFRDEAGRVTSVTQRRLVSMATPHLAGLESTFMAENWSGTLTVESAIDGRVSNRNVERYAAHEPPHIELTEMFADEEVAVAVATTLQSRIRVAEATRTRIKNGLSSVAARPMVTVEPDVVAQTYTLAMNAQEPVTVEKIVAVFTSKDHATSEPAEAARLWVARAADFGSLSNDHRVAWNHLWRRARIEIEDGANDTQEVIDLHLFHLLQSVSENSIGLDVGVPARGLHGEAYRGHIFWDELLVFPFLNLRFPELTRTLLLYRYRRLPEARRAARELGFDGAMFPWQSGSDGRDETPRQLFNPRSGRWMPDNSWHQRHVGLAVAYNLWLYYEVTEDIEFMSVYGAEMIIEVARFFVSAAEYNAARERYELRGVMGPDEYHDGYPGSDEPGLNNNAYTNIMTAWLLMRAQEVFTILPPEDRDRLVDRLAVRPEEVELWEEVSRKLYIEIDADGIISQFEGYADLEEFDWDGYTERYGHIERLDLILEAEGHTPNRYKLSKQPDVTMLFYLLSADELREIFGRLGYPFDADTIPNNLDYYERRTAHGSTLSRVVTAWVLSRADRIRSWELFKGALASDVEDIQGGTTREGIHLGAMAGTIDLIQRCYTGIETRDNVLWLGPLLPAELRAIRFEVHYREHWVDIEVLRDRVRIATRPGRAAPIRVGYKQQVVTMGPSQTQEFTIEVPA